MARIEGVNLPGNKRVEYGLPYVVGIGLKRSRDILSKLKINFDKRIKDLTDVEIATIQKEISQNYKVEAALRREIGNNIARLKGIRSYRGLRHARGLPVYGQRTKTNARTRKGPKKSIGSLKHKITKK